MSILTDSKIATAKPPVTGRLEIIDDKVPGLRLRVAATGLKTFIIRKRLYRALHPALDRRNPKLI